MKLKLKAAVRVTLTMAICCGLLACKKEPTGEATGDDKAGGAGEATKAAPAAADFKWTEAPTVAMIPAGPVKGEANGEPFVAKAIYFEPGFKEWRMEIHEGELKTPTAIRPSGQHITIALTEEPGANKKIVKAMKYGDGYFQVKKPDDPTKTTSWNASNAFALEITRWDVKPYDPKASMFQQAGTASGRVAITYKGFGKFKNSYAAGSFENVPVRYMGKPYWIRNQEKAEKDKAAATK